MKKMILACAFLFSLSASAKEIVLNDRSDISEQMTMEDATYIINSSLNLKGHTLQIPANSILVFQGGKLTNGTLIGNKTEMDCQDAVLSSVHIKGSWNMPIIHSSIFENAADPDVLKDLFALSDDDISNTIYIHPGTYRVSVSANTKGALEVRSRTNLFIDGTITLDANDFTGCSILRLTKASDVNIAGKGTLVGDRLTHTGTAGEWGMGIQIMGSENIWIEGLDIRDCWGDCIYIGDNSTNIRIENCNLHHARRQGISVTFASRCRIDRCKIHDIEGTAPEYGIDFEPNANCSVHQMTVCDTEIYNCKGGIIAGIKGITAENASVGDITICNCLVHSLRTNNTFRWHNCSNISVRDCTIDRPQAECTFKVDAQNVKYKNIKTKQSCGKSEK